MDSIQKAVQRFFSPKRFNQKFTDRIRQLVNSSSTDWDSRARKCSQDLLAAVCFRETALVSQRRKDSMIYQPIGLYYSMFHMSIAMLRINPRIQVSQLANIHHKPLGNLVKSELVEKKFIDIHFYQTLLKLRSLRESCNYRFGYQDNLDLNIKAAVKSTDEAFRDALHFVHQVLNESNSLFRVQVGIADGYGDDILDSYLTSKHKKRVMVYLANNGLSA